MLDRAAPEIALDPSPTSASADIASLMRCTTLTLGHVRFFDWALVRRCELAAPAQVPLWPDAEDLDTSICCPLIGGLLPCLNFVDKSYLATSPNIGQSLSMSVVSSVHPTIFLNDRLTAVELAGSQPSEHP